MANRMQYGGSPIKVGEEEFSLFRDSEYVHELHSDSANGLLIHDRILAKINE